MSKELQKLELQRILNKNPNKILLPEEVVDVARNPNNPLHTEFTWDDSEAATKYRLEEARGLIRKFEVVIHPHQTQPTRAFIHTSPAGYQAVETVLSSADLRERHLQDLIRKLENIKQEVQQFSELSELWMAIDSTTRKLKLPARNRKETGLGAAA